MLDKEKKMDIFVCLFSTDFVISHFNFLVTLAILKVCATHPVVNEKSYFYSFHYSGKPLVALKVIVLSI